MSEHALSNPQLASLVDELYAGTLDRAAWSRAVAGIARLVRATAGLLLAFNPATTEILREEIYELEPQEPGVPPDWRHAPVFEEFPVPYAPFVLAAWLHKSAAKCVTLSLQASPRRGAFDAQDRERFHEVLPHVARALEIRDRIEQSELRADILARCLDEACLFGAIVLDGSGRVLETNAIAREMLIAGDCVRRRADRSLWLREPAGTELGRCLSKGRSCAAGTDGLMHVPRSCGAPLPVMLVRLPEIAVAWIGSEPRWLILIIDSEKRPRISRELIAHELGISPGEAELAALLVGGCNLREAARQRGVSEHTARAQLKSIYRKTTIRSQSDLVRRVALGLAGRRGNLIR